jgi:DNA-binding transcriptional regulator LsrR (DeoR family)
MPARTTTIAAAIGQAKVPAIKAALAGGLINGLITDEATARAILD